ncbi:outer membrane beta-barrel protein [Pedobacter mucosus]|uniref:outer membrane beta-barrel protein n=1 Tax=Pedobacter mucosus TaxID=2895286 RepID=UPI001EE3B150|nr:outer membrane beta-barrel protein [Pedobacter mucosus]UKT66072.1 porin family protein [Pedobacter mucosus]
MKKQLLTLAAVCAVALASNAQTEKGQNLIGGSLGYSSSEQKAINNEPNSTDQSIYSISPSIGHFFSRNLAIGLSVGYFKGKSTYETILASGGSVTYAKNVTKSHGFNAGPFLRYYVDIAEKFKLFGQLNTSIQIGKDKSEYQYSNNAASDISATKTTLYIASINPGFAFLPAKKWAIEFSFPLLSYVNQKNNDERTNFSSSSRYEAFNFGLSTLNPRIGFNYLF